MRIKVLSDLHFEFGEVELPPVACDLVVLAGDIWTKCHGVRWALKRFPDCPVLYVAGNHEFYGENFPSLFEKLRKETAGTNVCVLENESLAFDGFSFFGCTLWSDFALCGDALKGAAEARESMNDYKRIRCAVQFYRRLSPGDTRRRHIVSRQAIEGYLAACDRERAVVVTHHAPSPLSLPERRREQVIGGAYASRLESVIEKYQPRLWIHGHIHAANDYHIGQTRIVANPRAYPNEPNLGFVPDLLLTL